MHVALSHPVGVQEPNSQSFERADGALNSRDIFSISQ